ncbi:aldo/keto reductase [Allomesorhizobium alhagi]|jgi:diketogulonate reductase-like aldo/keto reductase|uniref:2,5-didehydrogluconate reductase n=1 Tax=Mesorhizobium alhagi CCNWXJ12-2 TaxID=1107882 RepID=H0HRI2_9HYPH|nr:aldo/keto reductase [Mesorhizobium alhagi]EHK56646.1 2,5-didehydrogluconate reductase [Mesorhizobium alhagi CCNWXJ12-2]
MHNVNANGAAIPALGLGTWTLKGDDCAKLVTEALSIGYRHVDTAASYENEAAVGSGLRASGIARNDVFVTTKVWWTDIAPGDLERSAESSLKRLGLDQVDLLLIHWPNPQIPLESSIKALNGVKAGGLTRHIGVSNFTTTLLSQAIALSDAPLVANQVEHHPYLDQTKVLDACRKAGMALVSYCPLSRGGPLFEEKAVTDAAARHSKTPGQIVLRWHVQQEGVVAIPRTNRLARLAENFAIFDFALSDAEMAAISALSKANIRICDYDFSPQWDAA